MHTYFGQQFWAQLWAQLWGTLGRLFGPSFGVLFGPLFGVLVCYIDRKPSATGWSTDFMVEIWKLPVWTPEGPKLLEMSTERMVKETLTIIVNGRKPANFKHDVTRKL